MVENKFPDMMVMVQELNEVDAATKRTHSFCSPLAANRRSI